MSRKGKITQLLQAMAGGDPDAMDKLIPMVYSEMRAIAHGRMQGERDSHTLHTTALVHEAYLKLVDLDRIQYRDRAHFFAVAARAMRYILVNYARRRDAQKRGGGRYRVTLEDAHLMTRQQALDVLALEDALEHLQSFSERPFRVVECRFFAGLTIAETAVALDISPATVKRDWNLARAWLNRELRVSMAEKDASENDATETAAGEKGAGASDVTKAADVTDARDASDAEGRSADARTTGVRKATPRADAGGHEHARREDASHGAMSREEP